MPLEPDEAAVVYCGDCDGDDIEDAQGRDYTAWDYREYQEAMRDDYEESRAEDRRIDRRLEEYDEETQE